ncbi:hypothetical protein CcI49_13540 [Frankia sp. CcI49]|nr:hypothetical protein CcI49_13540 [Frankia sp. CcI49]
MPARLPAMDTLQVGDVSLTRIPHIEHWTLASADFFPDMNPGTWTDHRDRLAPAHWNPATDQVRIAVQSWLLRSDDRLVLVDTGLSAATTRPGVPAGSDLPAALAAVGVTAHDIDLVICTHLHADHVGWNTRPDGDGGWTPTFPQARYLFSEPDLRFFHPDTLVEQPGRSAAVFAESPAVARPPRTGAGERDARTPAPAADQGSAAGCHHIVLHHLVLAHPVGRSSARRCAGRG